MSETAPQFEVELQLKRTELGRIRMHPLVLARTTGEIEVRSLHAVYFDTPGLELARAGLALRVRRADEGWLQSLEPLGRGARVRRARREVSIPEPRPHPSRIPDRALRAHVSGAIAGESLEPVLETEVLRKRHRLRVGDAELYLDLDDGELRAAGERVPIGELTLALASGRAGALYDVALALHDAVPLELRTESRAQRGYALALGLEPPPEKARRPKLRHGALAHEALAAIVHCGLDQILANREPARRGRDPEGVHQLRVGLRRLRSALRLFRSALPREPAAAFDRELRGLAVELGAARDLDVFVAGALDAVCRHDPSHVGLQRLHKEALEVRLEAQERVRKALAAPGLTRLVLSIERWLASDVGRAQPGGETSAPLFAPAAQHGAVLLRALDRKSRRLGRDIAQRSPEEKHALRIQLKRLRYASEFLASLYPKAAGRKYIRRLAKLQETLGHLNDEAEAGRVLEGLLARLGSQATAEDQRAAGFVSGWVARDAERSLRDLERQWDAFARARRFFEVR